jgi:TPR repeat protein
MTPISRLIAVSVFAVLVAASSPVALSQAAQELSDEQVVLRILASAEKGNAGSQVSLGYIYEKGLNGVLKNDVEAMRWYRLAADQGDPIGQNSVGVMYANGEGVPKNDAEAVKWYRLAATQNEEAQFNLGVMYANGRGVSKNPAEAVRWYRRAADRGDSSAQFNLGLMYYNGEGVPRNDAEAVKWLRRAADQGIAQAQATLGVMYADGAGVPKNDAEAYFWFNLAAAQGNADAKHNRDVVEKKMTREQIAEAQRRSAAWKPKKE